MDNKNRLIFIVHSKKVKKDHSIMSDPSSFFDCFTLHLSTKLDLLQHEDTIQSIVGQKRYGVNAISCLKHSHALRT